MSSRTFTITAGAMVAVALAVRVYNAVTFPSLLGYDGFGHFTYVWYVAETGRVPLATSGWSFFHPPLYYALMAVLWKGLSGVDALTRLTAGSVIMGVLSLTHALVSYIIVRRFFPGDRLLHLMAPGLMLFLPVHIYTAPFIGNEGLTAVLCSLAILALLGVMWRPSTPRCVLLGVCLGLAMLAKFTAAGIVVGACAAIGLKSVVDRDFKSGLRRLAVVGAVMLAICGWYYARNVRVYGTPFKMNREEFMLRQVENSQPQAMRGFLAYVLFDPVIFRRPAWPRGFTTTDDTIPGGELRSLRESVWTGVYATTWLDGGWMLPSVTESERTRRAGQILLTLGLVPTSLVVLGLWTAIRRLWRDGWDDTIGALLLCFLAIVALFIKHTHAVPIPAAVKASYLMAATVTFSFWFALGLERLTKHAPRVRPYVVAECVTLAGVSVAVFAYGLLIPRRTLDPAFLAYKKNVTGVTYYAAGERAPARAWFASAAVDGSYVAHENLAALELEAGRPREARHLMKRAMRLEPGQSFGRPDDRAHLDRITRAEYLNSLAVIEQTLGRSARAVEAARAALRLDATIPEAHYNLGVLELLEARAPAAASPAAAALTRDAASRFARALALDPAFVEAGSALGAARALAGDCTAARRTLDEALTVRAGLRREFPTETGRGIGYAPAIGRRKRIDARAAGLAPEAIVAACNAAGDHGPAVGVPAERGNGRPALCLPPVFEGGKRLHQLPVPTAFWLEPLLRQHEVCWRAPEHVDERRIFLYGNSAAFGHPLHAEETVSARLNTRLVGTDVRAHVFNLGFVTTYQLKDALIIRRSLAYQPDAIVSAVTLSDFAHFAPTLWPTDVDFFDANAGELLAFAAERPAGLTEPLAIYRSVYEAPERRDAWPRNLHLRQIGAFARTAAGEYATSLRRRLSGDGSTPPIETEGRQLQYDCAEVKREMAEHFARWQEWNVLAYLQQVRDTTGIPVLVVDWPVAHEPVGDCYNYRYSNAAVAEYHDWMRAETRARALPYLDLSTLLSPEDFADSLHVTAEGYRKIAERMLPAVIELMGFRS